MSLRDSLGVVFFPWTTVHRLASENRRLHDEVQTLRGLLAARNVEFVELAGKLAKFDHDGDGKPGGSLGRAGDGSASRQTVEVIVGSGASGGGRKQAARRTANLVTSNLPGPLTPEHAASIRGNAANRNFGGGGDNAA